MLLKCTLHIRKLKYVNHYLIRKKKQTFGLPSLEGGGGGFSLGGSASLGGAISKSSGDPTNIFIYNEKWNIQMITMQQNIKRRKIVSVILPAIYNRVKTTIKLRAYLPLKRVL